MRIRPEERVDVETELQQDEWLLWVYECVCVRMNMQLVVSVNFAFNFLTFPRDSLNT